MEGKSKERRGGSRRERLSKVNVRDVGRKRGGAGLVLQQQQLKIKKKREKMYHERKERYIAEWRVNRGTRRMEMSSCGFVNGRFKRNKSVQHYQHVAHPEGE